MTDLAPAERVRGSYRGVARWLRAGCVLAALCLAACGGGAEPGAAAHPSAARWLHVEPANRRATLTLNLGYGSVANGYNLDGANKGALLFTVPARWTVRIRCVNRSSSTRYACVVADAPGSGQRALAVERSPHPRGGLAAGQAATFSFVVPRPGGYRLGAVTGGREPAGMWLALTVTRTGSPAVRWQR